MEILSLIDKAAVEVDKVKAVMRAIQWPTGNSAAEAQAADLLAVLEDEINLFSDTFREIVDEVNEGRRSA